MGAQIKGDALSCVAVAVQQLPSREDGSFSHQARHILQALGLQALTIPCEYGGFGADSSIQGQALWMLSKTNPSLALWYGMHTTATMFISALGTGEQKRRLFREVVEGGQLTAAATSEPGASFRDAFQMHTKFTPVEGGYEVDGDKHFVSMGRWAQRYFVLGQLEGSTTAKEGAIAASIRHGPGVDTIRRWEQRYPLGMRETASDSIRFKRVFVPSADVMGAPGELLASGWFANFAICYANVYGASGEAALEFTEKYLDTKKLPSARVGSNQKVLESARRRNEEVKFAIHEACDTFLHDRANAVLPIARAKLLACDMSMEIVSDMMQLVGGSCIFEAELPYGVWWRNIALSHVMPPSRTRCLEVIAKIESGQKGVTLLEFA